MSYALIATLVWAGLEHDMHPMAGLSIFVGAWIAHDLQLCRQIERTKNEEANC